MSLETPRAIIELSNLSKLFLHSRALDKVNLDILEGECLGVVGHNGAGKSTLVNILTGAYPQSAGEIRIDGQSIGAGYDVYSANSLGIRAVFQELSLCPNLSVVENMRVFHPNLRGFGWQRRAENMIMETMERIFPGHGIKPLDIVENLPLGRRQILEIAKAFTVTEHELQLIILDEPTSALDHQTSLQLTDYIRSLCGTKLSVVYISHLLDEVLACTDRIAVLKDGKNVGVLDTATATRQKIINLMGKAKPIRNTDDEIRVGKRHRGEKRVQAAIEPRVDDGETRIRVWAGEIIGLAGLANHGQTQLLHALFNHRRNQDYYVRGATTFVPGDRQRDGIFPLWSIAKNLSIQVYDQIRKLLMIDPKKEKSIADKWKTTIDIKADSVFNGIMSLSGGNQQKVLFARCLESRSPIVLMDDPTRGVDVGTKDEIYRLIIEESRKGRSFVWYTTEMGELKYCDRIYVFKSGKIFAELAGNEATEENILKSSFCPDIVNE